MAQRRFSRFLSDRKPFSQGFYLECPSAITEFYFQQAIMLRCLLQQRRAGITLAGKRQGVSFAVRGFATSDEKVCLLSFLHYHIINSIPSI